MSEKLRIPEEGYKGLEILQGLKQDGLKEFLSALSSAPLSFDRDKLFSLVQETVSKIASDDLQLLLRTIFSLHVTYSHSSRKLNVFLDDIIYAVKNSDKYSKNFINTDWGKFRNVLEKIFAIESLLCLSKAVDIVAEHACIYTGSRILTDIRPVFGVNEAAISALFVTNTLKLEYYKEGEEHELFIALDEDDIKSLIDTLQRAQSKAKSIKETVKVEKIPYIEN